MSNKTVYPWQRYQNNPLIVKDDVGKAKPNTYPIPDFAFGQRVEAVKHESLAEVLCHLEHFPSMDIRPQKDYKRINKLGIQQHLTTSKELNEFIKTHEIRQKIVQGKVKETEVPKQTVFGRKNRTPSPIKDVLSFNYGKMAEQKQAQAYTARPSTAQSRLSVETKSSRLLKESIRKNQLSQTQPENLKKLAQFTNIKAKTKSRY